MKDKEEEVELENLKLKNLLKTLAVKVRKAEDGLTK
jgi:hypothetical protein